PRGCHAPRRRASHPSTSLVQRAKDHFAGGIDRRPPELCRRRTVTPAHKRDRHGFRGVPPPPVSDFDALTDGALLNEYETAAVGRWSTNTLAAWRREGHGLRWVVIGGGRVRYRVGDVRAYLADAAPRKRQPGKHEPGSRTTADAGPAPPRPSP